MFTLPPNDLNTFGRVDISTAVRRRESLTDEPFYGAGIPGIRFSLQSVQPLFSNNADRDRFITIDIENEYPQEYTVLVERFPRRLNLNIGTAQAESAHEFVVPGADPANDYGLLSHGRRRICLTLENVMTWSYALQVRRR